MSHRNPPPSAFGRHQDRLLAHRPPQAWLDGVLSAGFSIPDLRPPAPRPSPPTAPARPPAPRPAPAAPDPPLEILARRFAGHPAAAALAQALWLTQCGQRHLRRGRLMTAHSMAARALAAKPDLFPAYALLAAALRQKAQAGGLFGLLHQALDVLEDMPRVMTLLGWRLGLDQCGSLVLAEWAAALMLLGQRAAAAARLAMALEVQARAVDLPAELRDFLVQAGCLADAELTADLERTRRRLLRG